MIDVFSIDKSSSGMEMSIAPLMEEVKLKVLENYEFENRYLFSLKIPMAFSNCQNLDEQKNRVV